VVVRGPPFDSVASLLEHTQSFAVKMMRMTGELQTMFIVVTPDTIMPVMAPWASDVQKETVLLAIGKLMREHGATMYAVLSEVWVATESVSPGRTAEEVLARARRPSERPDRREGVLVAATDGNLRLGQLYETHRRPDGRVADLVSAGPADDRYTGRLLDLLDGGAAGATRH
jgi:hypothetical protein